MVGSVEGVLSIRPDLYGLLIAPAIPSSWDELTIEKIFRRKKLRIKIQNPDGKESGYKQCYLNSQLQNTNYFPASLLNDDNEILLVM